MQKIKPARAPSASGLKEFGRRLRTLRAVAGMPAEELADKLGFTTAAIYNWEQGTRDPGVGRLGAIAQALGCTPADLVARG